MYFNFRFTACIAVSAIVTGCGSSDRVPVYPVRGTIRLEGKSMPGGGSIAFIPIDDTQVGKTAGGEIAENGTYVLTTYAFGDGSMEGYFRVVISQALTIERREAIPDAQKAPKDGTTGVMVDPENCIPAIYSDFGKSPLRATVEPRSNELNFDLQRTLEPAADPVPRGVASRERLPLGSTRVAIGERPGLARKSMR